jgi:hypothetical protein
MRITAKLPMVASLLALLLLLAACPHEPKPWDHRPFPGHKVERTHG